MSYWSSFHSLTRRIKETLSMCWVNGVKIIARNNGIRNVAAVMSTSLKSFTGGRFFAVSAILDTQAKTQRWYQQEIAH
jgi:hypothetical protein